MYDAFTTQKAQLLLPAVILCVDHQAVPCWWGSVFQEVEKRRWRSVCVCVCVCCVRGIQYYDYIIDYF